MDIADGIRQIHNSSENDTQIAIAERRQRALGVSSVPLLMSLYLFGVLLAYDLRFSHVNHRDKSNANRFRKKEELMRRFLLISAFVIFVRQIVGTLEISEGFASSDMCSVLTKLEMVLFAMGFWLIYCVLWMRQRVLYDSCLSDQVSTMFTRTLSGSVIVIMTLMIAGGVVINTSTREYVSSEFGCILKNNSNKLLAWVSNIVSVLLFQLILLFLFIYPILKQFNQSNASRTNRLSSTILNLLRRVVIAASIDIVLDIVLLTMRQRRFDNLLSLSSRVINFDYLILVKSCICVICGFSDWKMRLFPFACCKSNDGANVSS